MSKHRFIRNAGIKANTSKSGMAAEIIAAKSNFLETFSLANLQVVKATIACPNEVAIALVSIFRINYDCYWSIID